MDFENLPDGWEFCDLEDICSIKTGKKDANEESIDGKYLFFTCAAIPLRSNVCSFQGESLILPGNGANVGLVTHYDGEFEAYQRTYVLNNLKINGRFLYFYFKKFWKDSVKDKQYGSATNYIRLGNFKNFRVALPPLNEQKRIVKKVEALSSHVRRSQEALEEVPKLIEQFRRSVLAAAFRGDLTADWRKQNPDIETIQSIATNSTDTNEQFNLGFIPETWQCIPIQNIGDVKGGKRLPKGEKLINVNTGFPYIKAGDLKDGTVKTKDLQYISKEVHEKIKRYTVKGGDVYITIVGACIGDSGVIPQEMSGANLTENAAKISNLKEVSSEYLAFWLRSPVCQKIIQQKTLSAAQGKLALSRIKTIPLPVPTIREQCEIIQRINKYFLNIDYLQDLAKTSFEEISQLNQSILAKAFRGELVPQDPNDEPAAVLLERIRAEQAQPKSKKKAPTQLQLDGID